MSEILLNFFFNFLAPYLLSNGTLQVSLTALVGQWYSPLGEAYYPIEVSRREALTDILRRTHYHGECVSLQSFPEGTYSVPVHCNCLLTRTGMAVTIAVPMKKKESIGIVKKLKTFL